MRDLILAYPNQISTGFKIADEIKNFRISRFRSRVSNVVICGMGGSALPGELLKLAMGNIGLEIPVHIHRNYGLPLLLNQKSKIPEGKLAASYGAGKNQNNKPRAENAEPLIVCISYSGNTEETLSAYEEALTRELVPISITIGGKLAELARKNNTPLIVVPKPEIPARMATGYQFGALLGILEQLNLINHIREEFEAAAKNCNPSALEYAGKELAKKIAGNIPLIYASQRYKAFAYILKTKLNENSKTPAFWNYFPELNHNEIVGFTNPQNISTVFQPFILILKAENEHPRIMKRMELMIKLLKDRGHKVEVLLIEEENIWDKILHSMVLSDWISYYLALEYGVDPIPTNVIEEFKKLMEQ